MSTPKQTRGRPVDLELDAKVTITSALQEILQCSMIEAARMVAQAERTLLLAAFQAAPVNADLVLEAISHGAFGVTFEQAESDRASATTLSARAFPAPETGELSSDTKHRRAARIRKLMGANAEAARQAHPSALNIERNAQAIMQGLKTRRARNAADADLVDALQRALIAFDEHDDSSEPWTLG